MGQGAAPSEADFEESSPHSSNSSVRHSRQSVEVYSAQAWACCSSSRRVSSKYWAGLLLKQVPCFCHSCCQKASVVVVDCWQDGHFFSNSASKPERVDRSRLISWQSRTPGPGSFWNGGPLRNSCKFKKVYGFLVGLYSYNPQQEALNLKSYMYILKP